MASKVQVAKFPLHDFNEGLIDPAFSGVWNMEEDDVAGQLKDDSFKKRVEVLEQLIITVKRNGGRLPYADGESIFRSLGLALSDSNWEIRHKCIQLLQEIIPNLGEDIDTCMSLVLNKMLTNIGDSKVTVRRAVVQALHTYMKHTRNLPALFDALVKTGLENENASVRREMVNALPMLLTKDFTNQDLSKIVMSLAKKLLDTSSEDNLKDSSLSTLNKIEGLVGEKTFALYLKRLSVPLQNFYLQLSGKQDLSYYNNLNGDFGGNGFMHQGMMNGRNDSRRGYVEESLEFGVVPSQILSRINDQKDFRTRAQAVEDLKSIISNTSYNEVSTSLMPHMNSFISFLSNLLDDSNFKIINVTLEIFLCLVEKLDKSTKNFVRPLVSALLKRMGDNKFVIRQIVMNIVKQMMKNSSPQAVITVLEDNLQHRNSRVRQETINFIIAALLTFPRYEFDLPRICNVVGPTLTDVKRAVRQAALECFAMLAQVMGVGQLGPLVSAVDQVELSTDGEGLMAAVQARLARKQLPRLTSEGLVEYATQTPSSATVRSSTIQSADTEWIMAVGAGMSGTARTSRSDVLELESVTTSARSTPMVGSDVSAPTPAPRRFMSAGRGRNKLPWEEDRDDRTRAYNELPNSAPTQAVSQHEDAPPRPRQMWVADGEQTPPPPPPAPRPADRQPPKRRTTVMGITSPEDMDTSGSYTQLYQQKLRRQQAGGGVAGRGSRPDDIKDNGFNRQDQRTPRTFLDPISVDVEDSATSATPTTHRPDEDEAPVPRKATMARGSATRRKVPPISPSSDFYDDNDSAYAASDDGRSGITGSLKTIRNSATKKRVDKMFERIEKQSSKQSSVGSLPSSSDPLGESGVFSANSHTDSARKPVKKFEAKSSTYSNNSSNSSGRGKRGEGEAEENKTAAMTYVDYNPISGVTFRENRNSDVKVVGRGYAEEGLVSSEHSSRPPVGNNRLGKDRRRFSNRGPLMSHIPVGHTPVGHAPVGHAPLGHAPQWQPSDGDTEDKLWPTPDSIALVGRGVFDTSANSEHASSVGQSQDSRLDRRRQDMKAAPPGVVGVAVRSTADLSTYSSDVSGPDEDDDESNFSMTQSLKEKVAVRQQQRQEEDERRRAERERKEREKEEKKEREREEKLRKEKERQQEKLKRLSSAESLSSGIEFLSVSGSGSASNLQPVVPPAPTGHSLGAANTGPLKAAINPPRPPAPAVTPRKIIKTNNEPVSTFPMPVAAAPTPQDSENPADWKPFKDSEVALRDLTKKLEQDDWEVKCEGLNMLRRLSMHHADTVQASLHAIVLVLMNEVKNLRSQVSRLAMTAVGDMFVNLKKGMDPEVEISAKTLLAKAGESNQFIREDVEKALVAMMDNVTPQRALLGLIAGGASHKNAQIRKTTAQFLVELVDRMGSGRILSGVKDITDRVLPTAAQFAMDGSQETRYYGRSILYKLMSHQDFDRMLTKYLPANTLRNIQDIVDTLKQKGLGERPSELSSARSRRSGHGSRSNSSIRSSSADSGVGHTTRRRALVRTDEARMEEVKAVIGLMAASNWQQRYEGVSSFLSMCETNPTLVASQIIKIFDKFLPLLKDANSKVNLYALQTMLQVTPMLKDAMGSVISMTVEQVVPNLSSKNKEIYTAAAEILDAFIEHLDSTMLVQPFANQAIRATARSKADMVIKVAYLAERVYPRKQKPVVLHVLPVLWHLLGCINSSGTASHGGAPDLRQATVMLVSPLYDLMGQGLMEKASAEPSMTQRQIQLLHTLVEG
ncbi:TOG array regulator of axonemal microtubules protein 1 [Aplysia californica]|uniref:TOG array regulator of axonemal microtubules protein 1 n=1 Tax=Aplysia californica TaxID=6500 RepID=A0ABM1W2K8_APLCA|nr:TOG array regulator of axonemal microtubules protein 1 [Aplysia californica]